MSSTDRARFAALAAVALAASATLAGCASARHAPEPAAAPLGFDAHARNPLEQYKIAVERAPDRVAVSIHPQGLSESQRAALADFIERWRDTGGTSVVVVEAPVGGAEPADPRFAARAVASALNSMGVPPSLLRMADYSAGSQPGAPVVARYERYQAIAPDCAHAWDDVLATKKNESSQHFGCTVAANLAASIADPRDLLRPAPSTPADNLRRAIVLDKYRHGVVTSSPLDPQAQGVVSGN